MIRVIAKRELKWIDYKTDYRQWSNLCRSFGVHFEVMNVLPKARGCVVVLDQSGDIMLNDFVHPEKDCTYVFGCTGDARLQDRVRHDYAVRINTPENKSMFGICAAAIVLYDRLKKSQW